MERKLQCITVELFANATKMTMFGVNGLQYTTNKIVTPLEHLILPHMTQYQVT